MTKRKPEPIATAAPLSPFLSVRPRGQDAPARTPRGKPGPKTALQVLNIKGQRQAPLQGRANPDVCTIDQWKAGTDKTRQISKAAI